MSIYRLCQYVLERLDDKDLAYLSSFSDAAQVRLGNLSLALYHHLPEKNAGRELVHDGRQEDFDRLFVGTKQDMVVYGHVHMPLLRYSSRGQLILNPGSIGQPHFPWKPLGQDLRAQYAILEIDSRGIVSLQHRHIDYDRKHELVLAKAKGLPYLDLYEELLYHGKLYTHQEAFLQTINQQTSYEEDLRKWPRKTYD